MTEAPLRPEASCFVVANFVMACCWQVPYLPAPGQTLQAVGLTIEPGGKGLNVAVGLHRLGLDVLAQIACGKDTAGTALRQLFAKEGMDTSALIDVDGASGYGAGMIGQNGQNAIAVYPGANLLLSAAHVDAHRERLLASHLVYGQFETQIAAVAHAFELAAKKNILTVLNPSPWQVLDAAIEKTLRTNTQVLLMNETEAEGLLGIEQTLPADAKQCYELCQARVQQLWSVWTGLKLCVITLGAQGCLVFCKDSNQAQTAWAAHMPARKINAVDTVGAGDAFASGFCAVLAHFEKLKTAQAVTDFAVIERACQWGHWMGAYMASQMGVLGALAPLKQVQLGLKNEPVLRLIRL